MIKNGKLCYWSLVLPSLVALSSIILWLFDNFAPLRVTDFHWDGAGATDYYIYMIHLHETTVFQYMRESDLFIDARVYPREKCLRG